MENIWWKNAVGYQIYIRSFFDGNNDGVGDLVGITQKLDYLKDLGVDFIWICPFYDSPMDDNGYDIRDYYKIDKMYGKMADLKKLIKEAHNRNIKVIIDLVMNHTSDENEWFIKSENKEEPFSDFYVWHDGIIKDGKHLPPNNWQSFFSGSAWKFSEKRNQFYLKIFSNKMPDINYENEFAFSEMEKVVEFYANLNVDGFRLDAISHLAKDRTFASVKNLKKTYTGFTNQPDNYKYLKRFKKTFLKHNLVTMGELCGFSTPKQVKKYCDEETLDMVFSFEQDDIFTDDFKINTKKLIKILEFKQNFSEKTGWAVLFWLNHDYPRLISKVRNEADAKNAQICLAGLMYMLKGTPLIYNGEEIGMENYAFKSPDEFKDVNAKMLFENTDNFEKTFNHLKEKSRDNSRTIMQWNATKFAGFSNTEPWIFVNDNYKTCNVEKQLKDENSILSNYKRLVSVRKCCGEQILSGKYKFFSKNGIVGYRIKNTKKTIEVVANLSQKDYVLPVKKFTVIYSNFDSKTLKPYQIMICEH